MKIGGALIGVVVFIILLRQFLTSAFFFDRDRIQIALYGETPSYFSLERGGSIHYVTTFTADSRTSVPGGYDVYRIGGIGKLVELEKKPAILQRTFSRITGSMTDFYFYPQQQVVYYGDKEEFHIPTAGEIFLLPSNANIFDRIYIWLQFIGKSKNSLDKIAIKKIQKADMVLLSDQTFARQFLGFFYQKTLREENKTVQIIYGKSYMAAKNASRIIDGEGIRVVDIDSMPSVNKPCEVVENTQSIFSKTAKRLSSFFSCKLVSGKGRLSDIVLYLNNTEKDWE
jgi:hypothetical protein